MPEVTVCCPTEERWPGDLVGCGSTNVDGPDEDGYWDCLDCGIWFLHPDPSDMGERGEASTLKPGELPSDAYDTLKNMMAESDPEDNGDALVLKASDQPSDYVLVGNSCWVEVDSISVYIVKTADGVSVELCPNGYGTETLASAYTSFAVAEEVLAEHKDDLPEGVEAVCENCEEPCEYDSDMCLCGKCAKEAQ